MKNSMKDELQAAQSEEHLSFAFIKKTYDLLDAELLGKLARNSFSLSIRSNQAKTVLIEK
ncbi:hypothetical protein QQB53_01245 [Niallia sp. SS-2023]|nr:hypothetical protein [Niallia sp. SS-2023]MDL0434373.1 hypothetical protein [Niallia sp. SS-2023]